MSVKDLLVAVCTTRRFTILNLFGVGFALVSAVELLDRIWIPEEQSIIKLVVTIILGVIVGAVKFEPKEESEKQL